MLIAALTAAPMVSGCTTSDLAAMTTPGMQPLAYADAPAPAGSARVHALITRYATDYHVPESLVHRVVARESGYNPAARNGAYWGLMQISVPTARTMGFAGKPAELLNADTNLRYAVKYLAGAYMVAGHNEARAMHLYQSGYYYKAKRKGLLVATGLASL
jgi:soluble lytic murein transglycosylase-like protein